MFLRDFAWKNKLQSQLIVFEARDISNPNIPDCQTGLIALKSLAGCRVF